MSKLPKIVIGIGFSFLIILIAVGFFLRHLVIKSFPLNDGSLTIDALHQSVEIFRDEYGVPHIRASDEHDLMVAAGYVHAQDRLWQMDLLRRASEGRLSEILGTATLNFDKLFRTIGLRQTAHRIAQQLHPESQRVLEDYAVGVNAFIAQLKGEGLPAEFDMLNYKPEPWTIEHSILIGRLIAWELNLAWWTDLTYGEIATVVSQRKLQEILLTYPDSFQVTVPSYLSKKTLSEMRELLDINASYRSYFGLGSLEAGSNAWAVDSSKSFNGKPLLANDPHLAMPSPSRWYELHLNAPGWNVAGVSLPGTPFIIIGHNDHLAWGLTNAMLDDADFYIEKVDSTNPHHYIFQKTSFPFEEHEEKISIKDADSITIICRTTQHGPVVNDVHPASTHHQRDTSWSCVPITLRWTGLEMSDELYGFYLIDHATNYHEFEQGVKEITVPGQSIVYADVKGNIAYWTSGRVPLRGKQQPMMPLPGWTGDAEWKGYVPFEEMPKVLNPPEGIIACANQKISDTTYPYYLSTLWEPPSRIQRIRQLLRSAEKFSSDDFKQFQQDVTSPFARELLPYIFTAYNDSGSLDARTVEALNYLHNWDGRFTSTDIASTIFDVFFMHLLHNTYEDEMDSSIFHDFVFYGAIPYRVTSQLLISDSSGWWDDMNTPQVETKNNMIRKSLTEAINELCTTMGEEMKHWQWGRLHTVTFKHPFGVRKPLDRVFNVGPFTCPGSGTTLFKTEYKFTMPYETSVGPSMREVIDLARPQQAFMVITSGQSGQPFNKHYDDQTPLWLNGGYHEVTTDWGIIKNSNWDLLELRPQ